ncbi:uncharacterized protein LOC124925918 [Impatiens glandulifera]|uniref:uncharacterized protein LOC124925918 n=1 Tax=Impatiens glandulifera TaxID=253017 RepID=UPI001FB0D2A7|nr:uncharacterized protein LOC124925918 [Impatiens glandulifera]
MAMMQSGVAASKVLVLVAGAGLTGSIVLRSGQLSDLISQLQELIKGVNESEISPEKFDTKLLAAQIQNLAKEIREYTGSRPITIVNESTSSNGTLSSYMLPAAALGAAGYCYMWWKGWSLNDVMFVTKHNMENAVATVSKKLEHVSEALNSTRKHLSKKLENLDWKLDEQMETSRLIANDVTEVRTNLNQIGYDIESIQQLVFGLEGKLENLESKQDVTNTGLWYLCQVAGGTKNEIDAKPLQDVGTKLLPTSTKEENAVKGLQFLVDSDKQKPDINSSTKVNIGNGPLLRTRFHRPYPIGVSLPPDGLGGF